MIADIILICVAILWLGFASYVDLKTREVPDWLSFSLIGIGLGVRLIHSLIFSEWGYFLYGLLGFGIMLGLGSLIYYTKQWGGGDAKLLMGFGAVFATTPFYLEKGLPFLVKLMANILVVGGFYGLSWSVFLGIRHWKKVGREIKNCLGQTKKFRITALVITFVMLGVFAVTKDLWAKVIWLIIIGLLLAYPYLFVLIKAVENVALYKLIPPFKLTEGDWIEKEIRVGGKVICGPKDLGVTKKQIAQLKKFKIKEVLVKEGIPFVPSFFIGVILALLGINCINLISRGFLG